MYEQLDIFSLISSVQEQENQKKFHPVEEYAKHIGRNEDRRKRIVSFFMGNPNLSERSGFLKEECGIGGFVHPTDKAFVIYCAKSTAKGCEIEFYDGNMGVNKLKISYAGLAKAIDNMIREGKF